MSTPSRHPTAAAFPYAESTALVTGATSGIGHALARAVAARGVPPLAIAARTGDDLDRVAAELRAGAPGLEVETVAVDLNARAVVRLAERAVPAMAGRGRGGGVHVGSTAADSPVPYSAVYGATKAFVVSFSQALWAEYRLRGVRVTCVVPGVTRTNTAGPDQGEPRGGLEALSGVLEPPRWPGRRKVNATTATNVSPRRGARTRGRGLRCPNCVTPAETDPRGLGQFPVPGLDRRLCPPYPPLPGVARPSRVSGPRVGRPK
jgi:NAD(P)-dependent dehydrogenase (short-subunit alcohol dehydrogenase family)